MPGAKVLEIGCGQGVGVEIILGLFGASRVDAFDLDPRMVAIARRRLASRGSQVRLWVGDAIDIHALDVTYDAVFDFGIIHHVSNWRQVLAEANRVLLPGGLLFAEEPVGWVTKSPFLARLCGYWQEDVAQLSQYGFEASEFRLALGAAGFVLQKEEHLLRVFSWFVASKAMTAQGAAPNGDPAASVKPSNALGGPPSPSLGRSAGQANRMR